MEPGYARRPINLLWESSAPEIPGVSRRYS